MIKNKNFSNNEIKEEKLKPINNNECKKEDYMYGGKIKVI